MTEPDGYVRREIGGVLGGLGSPVLMCGLCGALLPYGEDAARQIHDKWHELVAEVAGLTVRLAEQSAAES